MILLAVGLLVAALGVLALVGCSSTPPATADVSSSSGTAGSDAAVGTETGIASYYGHQFHGRRTASGEIYDEEQMTAAHRSLPFGTRVRVTNLDTGASVVLRITDRGPFKEGRIIDVSYRAARELGFLSQGLVEVRVDILETEE